MRHNQETCLLGTEQDKASLILRHSPLPWARQEWSSSVGGHVHRISISILNKPSLEPNTCAPSKAPSERFSNTNAIPRRQRQLHSRQGILICPNSQILLRREERVTSAERLGVLGRCSGFSFILQTKKMCPPLAFHLPAASKTPTFRLLLRLPLRPLPSIGRLPIGPDP